MRRRDGFERNLGDRRRCHGRRRFKLEALEDRDLLAGIEITEFMAKNDGALVDGRGVTSDWIEVFNSTAAAHDLGGYYLTDDQQNLTKWRFPSVTLESGGFLVVFASSPKDDQGETLDNYVDPEGNLHTNFKLSGGGEFLALTEPDGQTIASAFAPYPQQRDDVSYGKEIFGDTRRYYPDPTPGFANEEGVVGFVEGVPAFDIQRGFYSQPFDVEIEAPPETYLVYTLDGSRPSATNGVRIDPAAGTVATASVHVATTATVRAGAFREGYHPSKIDTHSYLFATQTIQQPRTIDGIPPSVDLEFDPAITNDPRFSDEIEDALRAIPSMSIVMDHDDLFGTRNGIYTHPLERGIEWERLASVELILPDGSTGFQEDAGVRIFGATTRRLPKKPFRISFRSEYGAKKLEYPLFPDSPADAFDNVVLRAQQTNSWQRPGRTLDTEQADFLEDTWARDAAKAMGKLDGHSTFVHLYLNGLYWGVYNPVERPDSSFGEEYLGGSEEDYDAINRRPVEFNGEGTVAIDGDLEAWKELMELAAADLSIAENYEAIQAYISVDNVIQQFLLHQYMGHLDGPGNGHLYNNMRLIRERAPNAPFYAFAWDMEYSFVDVHQNVNIDFPPTADTMSFVYDALRANPDFRMRYADLSHRYLFNDGALTPAKAAERYDLRAAVIESAIIGETARWGDVLSNHRRPGEPFNRDDEWATERSRMLNEYFPLRAGILTEQLTQAGLYPTVNAPRLLIDDHYQHGGDVLPNATLTFTQELRSPFVLDALTAADEFADIYVPAEGEFIDDLSWTERTFDVDAPSNAWGASGGIRAQVAVGFDSGNGRYDDLIVTDIGTLIAEKQSTSVFLRREFSVPHEFEYLQLDMKYDDGFVAYINGTEVARSNAGETSPPAKARASTSRESVDAESFRIDLSRIDLNANDSNVLAVHVLNRSATNNDLLADPVLFGARRRENVLTDEVYYSLDGTDPRAADGGIAGSRFGAAVTISESVHLKARSLKDGEWSALTEAMFSVTNSIEGDFDLDNRVDLADIQLISLAVRSGADDQQFDLTGDGNVDRDDRGYLIKTLLKTDYGDANLDGVFDTSDLVQVLTEGKFSPNDVDGVAANWAEGDWDGDGVFGTRDLVIALTVGFEVG